MKDLHLAIGTFDGLHLGHRALLHKAIAKAQETQAWSGVLSFYPHPKKVLRLPNAPDLIYPIQQRRQLFQALALDYIFIKRFTLAWSHFLPDRFFDFLKRIFPNLHTIYVGEDFRFGYQRQGDVRTLEALCQRDPNVRLSVSPRLQYAGEVVCSSRIRLLLQSGQWTLANSLLSLPYHRWIRLNPLTSTTYTVQHLYPYELKPPSGHHAIQLETSKSLIHGQLTLKANGQMVIDTEGAVLDLDKPLKMCFVG